MDAIRVALLCVAGAVLCTTLRAQRPDIALGLAMATGLVALGMTVSGIREVVEAMRKLCSESGVDTEGIRVMLKAMGIALACEFAAQLCRDAGESALAARAEIAGRVTLAALAAPMLARVVTRVASLFG